MSSSTAARRDRRWAPAKSRSRSTTPTGRLAIDANEVHVTRRVYRSGEGEYLINRQPCRLRDIRELLAGTGHHDRGLLHHRAGQGRRAAAIVAARPAGDLRRSGRHQPVQGQEGHRDAPDGARRAKSAAAVGHRRRSREPAAERAVTGRQGRASIANAPSGCSSCAPKLALVDWRALHEAD